MESRQPALRFDRSWIILTQFLLERATSLIQQGLALSKASLCHQTFSQPQVRRPQQLSKQRFRISERHVGVREIALITEKSASTVNANPKSGKPGGNKHEQRNPSSDTADQRRHKSRCDGFDVREFGKCARWDQGSRGQDP